MVAYALPQYQPYGAPNPATPPPPPLWVDSVATHNRSSLCTRTAKVVYAIAILLTAVLAVVIPVVITQRSNPTPPPSPSPVNPSPSPGPVPSGRPTSPTAESPPPPPAAPSANTSACLRINARNTGEDQDGIRLERSDTAIYCDVPFTDGNNSGRIVCGKAFSTADLFVGCAAAN